MTSTIPLEKKLAQEPIALPGNPFWDVFKRFGRDEAIALLINVAGTAGLEQILHSSLATAIAPATKETLLAVTGPVIEKIGFFPAHFREAWGIYSTTPLEQRGKLSQYVKKALHNSSKSLLEDLFVHDPTYVGLMYGGLHFHPETPAWLLSSVSFIASIFVVAALEVGATELRYLHYKKQLQKIGFKYESYLESRFCIDASENPSTIIEALTKEFALPRTMNGQYHDKYIKNNLPHYSGRIPQVRLRRRMIEEEGKEVCTAQIIYTRAAEITGGKVSQFRYFPQRKEKMYYPISEIPSQIGEINNSSLRRELSRIKNGEEYDITFNRQISYDTNGLLVAVDQVGSQKQSFYVVELKVRHNPHLLKEAMRYVMLRFPVVQTTHGKFALSTINGK